LPHPWCRAIWVVMLCGDGKSEVLQNLHFVHCHDRSDFTLLPEMYTKFLQYIRSWTVSVFNLIKLFYSWICCGPSGKMLFTIYWTGLPNLHHVLLCLPLPTLWTYLRGCWWGEWPVDL
jgi:hypothetical protein